MQASHSLGAGLAASILISIISGLASPLMSCAAAQPSSFSSATNPHAVEAWLKAMQHATQGGLVRPRWDAAGAGFIYADAAGQWWRVDPDRAQRKPVASPPAEREPPVVRSMFPMAGYDRREEISPNRRWTMTLIGPDLAIRSSTGELWQVTADGAEDRQYFGASDIWEASGSPWAPDGNRLVFRRHDMRSVNAIDWLRLRPDGTRLESFRYWTRTGQPLPCGSLFVADPSRRHVVPLGLPSGPDHYLFFLEWRPDGAAVAMLRVARDLSVYEVHEADTETGATRLLHREVARDGMVRWPSGRNFHYLKGGGFLWRTNSGGHFAWNRHAADGRRLGAAAAAPFDLDEIVHIDTAGRIHVMGGASAQRPLDRQLLRFDTPRRFRQLAPVTGISNADFSPDGRFFILAHHDLDRPPVSELRRADGSLVMQLDEAIVSPERRRLPMPEPFVTMGADGRFPVHGIILKPPGFKPTHRYPVIERIYGGMQNRVVPRGWWEAGPAYRRSPYALAPLWFQSQGFVVVMMDAAGTPGLGRAHHVARFGTWPDGIIADHAAALRAIAATRPWMDLNRVGVDGNSWGGMLALRAVLEAPDLYHAAVAAVPQTDMIDHVAWSEFQLGRVADNPSGYQRAALASRAAGLARPILLISGDADVNVPVSNSLRFMAALNAAGIAYRHLPLPGTNHAHRLEDGTDLSPLAIARTTDFFRDELGSAK